MGRLDELKEEIYKQAVPICYELGIEIIEMNLHSYNEVLTIQIFVDRPLGGVGIGECSALNHRLDKILYDGFKLGNSYTLEVSSPGLDRPLVTYRDFRRVIEREIHLLFREPVRGKREVEGLLTAVRESELILKVRNEEWLVPMDKIEKGKQIII